MSEEKNNKPTFMSEVLDLLRMLVISFLVVTILTTWVIKPIRVRGGSMYPTLEDGSIALSGLINMHNGVERFDIVTVFQDYKDQYLIKRVIGLPGETVEFRDNELYIDGQLLEQPFLDEEYTSTYDEFTGDFKIVLEDDQYFLMGDNRPNSSDSRVYGPFTLEDITSEDVFVVFPFDRFGSVE